MWKTEKKEACLGGYGHPDFVGQFKPAATFPFFFGNEYLDEGFELSLLSGIEHAIMGDVTADDLFPRNGKGNFRKFLATDIGKPLKHWRSLLHENYSLPQAYGMQFYVGMPLLFRFHLK